MTVRYEPYAIPFVAGIGTKTNDKALPAPKLLRAENVVFDELGTLRKRFGSTLRTDHTQYVSEGPVEFPLVEAKALIGRQDEVAIVGNIGPSSTGATRDRVWAYSDHADRWIDRGNVGSPRVTRETLVENPNSQPNSTTASTGGVRIIAWDEGTAVKTAYYTLIETDSGTVIQSRIPTSGFQPRAVAVGVYLHLYTITPAGVVELRVFDTANPFMAISGPTLFTVGSLALTTADTTMAVCASPFAGGTAWIAWTVTPGGGYKLARRTATGAASIAETLFDPGLTYDFIDLDVFSTGQTIVAFGRLTPATALMARAFTSALAPVAVAATIDVAGSLRSNVTVAIEPADLGGGVRRGRIYSTDQTGVLGGGFQVDAGSLDTNGTTITLATTWKRHSRLAGNAFLANGLVMVPVTIDTTPFGTTSQIGVQRSDVLYTHAKELIAWWNRDIASAGSYLTNVQEVGGGVFQMMRTYQNRIEYEHYADTAPSMITLDFEHPEVCRSVESGGTAYIAGGLVQQYDGVTVTELGFLQYPLIEGSSAAVLASANFPVGVTWSYIHTFEWTNAQGERERSAPSVVRLQAGNGANAIQLTLQSLQHSVKSDVSFAGGEVALVVWRTEGNPTDDAPYYRVSSADPATVGAAANGYVNNNPAVYSVSFVDNIPDSQLISREIFPSSQLENITPEPATIIAAVKDRVYLAGLPDQPHTVQYSLLKFPGETLTFNDALTIHIESVRPITAIGSLNENPVIFTDSQIFALAGDGPNNDGSGATFEARLISQEVGCVNQRSVVSTPGGIMFLNSRGLYMLTAGWQVQYLGADVEDYTKTQTITGATLIPDRHQVRFLSDTGVLLAFDYLVGQWSTFASSFSPWVGVASAIVDGGYLILGATGVVRDEDTTVFTDDVAGDIFLTVETAWVKLSTLQGYQRIRRAHVIGDYKSDHQLHVEVGYDYAPLFGHDATIDVTADPVQVRVNMRRQKCQAIQFRISDQNLAGTRESLSLTELRLDVGVKGGGNRLGIAKVRGAF